MQSGKDHGFGQSVGVDSYLRLFEHALRKDHGFRQRGLPHARPVPPSRASSPPMRPAAPKECARGGGGVFRDYASSSSISVTSIGTVSSSAVSMLALMLSVFSSGISSPSEAPNSLNLRADTSTRLSMLLTAPS